MASGGKMVAHEERCESTYEPSPDGCCSNGRRCDDLCIEIAAAFMCQQSANHSIKSDNEDDCKDACCVQPNDSHNAQIHTFDADNCCSEREKGPEVGGCCGEGSCGEIEKSEAEEDCCNTSCHDGAKKTEVKEDDCRMGCCGEVKKPEIKEDGCKKVCCGETKSDITGGVCQDACCGPIPLVEQADRTTSSDCKKTCCDQKTVKPGNLSVDTCGSNGPAGNIPTELCGSVATYKEPCKQERGNGSYHATECNNDTNHKLGCSKGINISCCEKEAYQRVDSSTDNLSNISSELETCSAHLEAAIRKFTAFLEAGLCICRSIMPLEDICCNEKKRDAVSRARLQRKERESSRARSSAVFMSSHVYSRHEKRKSTPSCQKKGCGADSTSAQCDEIEKAPVSWATVENPKFPTKATPNGVKVQTKGADVEQPAAHDHVTFNITGMTCTGCVKKVVGVFNHVPGVSNVNVNYVAGKAECDVDSKLITADQALRQLERETGFKCTQTFSTILALNVLMTKEDVQRLEETKLDGIGSIDCLGKGLYEVSFDPAIIGARKVLSTSNGRLAPPKRDKILASSQKALFLKLFSFIAATIMTIPVVVLSWGDPPISYNAKSITSLILATGVQLVAVPEFYIPALKALIFSRSIEMDMLVVISITAAYLYSVVGFSLTHAGYTLEEGEFFETSTLLITLVLLGRLVSTFAKLRAVSAVSLRSLQAETAYLEQDNSEPVEIDARLLEYDDVIRIPPHSHIVTDGEVIQGSSAVDESMITGESTPVSKTEGSVVIAGTINGIGPLRVRATRLPGQNSISDIANLVSDALGTKPKLQDLADVIAGYFVPVVVAIALIVLIIWLVISVKVRHENGGGAVGTAITYSIAVLAISCPCALGLAVPMVLVIAGGVAAKRGIIIKSGDATERAFKVTDVIFDKTGTLTLGDLQVLREEVQSNHALQPDVLGLAYSLVQDNEHPVSRALATHLRNKYVSGVKLKNVESIPGSGIIATWNGHVVKAGNSNWLNLAAHPEVTNLQLQGLTLLCITLNDDLIGTFGLQATTRPEADSTISNLQARGIQCHIVSGDNATAVKALARSLQIPEDNVAAQKKPEEKLAYIKAVQALTDNSNKNRRVLFVGDGTNDAAAIAQADFGLQIGDASDISRAAADVVLLGGLDGIITLLDVSKAAFLRITFNFIWSGLYNVFAILLASGAFVKFRVPPAYAGLGEIVSVLPVITVGFSMTLTKIGKANSAH